MFAIQRALSVLCNLLRPIFTSNTIVPLKLDFVAQKKGGMAVSAVWRLVYFSRTMPIGTKGADRSTQARRAVTLS